MDDVFLLSRIQFALTIMFHYIFPPLSIGLGAIMVIMEGTYLRTGNVIYHQMTRFWSRVFAVNFAMGVATGIVMEFQFGTNWAAFSRYVGDVFGSALRRRLARRGHGEQARRRRFADAGPQRGATRGGQLTWNRRRCN